MAPSWTLDDGKAWDRRNDLFEALRRRLSDKKLEDEVIMFVAKHRPGNASPVKVFRDLCRGGFNFHYRIRFSDGHSTIIRFPIPGFYEIGEEKVRSEVAAMRYIAENTTIPVPAVLHYGMTNESPCQLGPFIIMDYVDNCGDVYDLLTPPSCRYEEKPTLDPNIDEKKLEYVYSQMADVILQLSKCDFSRIGCLGIRGGDSSGADASLDVTSRPLSYNQTQLGEVGGIPHFELPAISKTFSSSSDYFSALADINLQQLSFQRNRAIRSANDCRRKYIARKLFRKLAAERRVSSPGTDHGPFKLWCDDLRPSNVLVDADHRIVAVIDWEFTYAAPAEFTYSPPSWLLLVTPEEWDGGLDDWAAKYEPRFETFLRVLEAKEREFSTQGRLNESQVLSTHMRRSWETGDFWLAYAARKSWAFDSIFWRSLNNRFFGKNEDGFMERLELLQPGEVAAMETLVERKLKEEKEATLIDWYAEDAKSKLPPDILNLG